MFTHLHTHTEYSLLDGVTRIKDLVGKVKDSGMKSCALTDHGSLYGAYKFHTEMKANDLKPIIGCEINVAPRGRDQKEHGIDNKYFHLTLLAMNKEGYRNLVKMVSIGHMEGYYYKPRVDIETLEKYNKGIIAMSACLSGVLSKPLQEGKYKQAKQAGEKYKEIFKDRFFIEIMRNGIELQEKVNIDLLKISKELDIPVVATVDSHFLNREDAEVQEVLWAIADGKTIHDESRRRLPTNEFYVKTPEEMKELFKDLPEALENTQKIDSMIEDYEMSYGRIEPQYQYLPKGKDSREYLKDLAYEGVEKKYGKFDKALKERTDYELSVIDEKGYNDYFLIVWQIVDFCRKNGIVVSMRGSGTGSIVAYGIDITSIDPLAWGLYFERFLNPERKSAPDFDIDLEDSRRHEVIKYVQDEFGEESVRQIITFSKLQTRQAIRDVSRVLGIDLGIADQLSKMVEIVFGKAKPIDHMIEVNQEFADIINANDENKRMADIVRKVSGLARGVSTHACGVLITPDPVTEYVAVQRDAHGEGIGIAQFEFEELEDVGLMKFDFLGLRNLGIVGTTLKKVKASKGIDIDLMKIDYEDKDTFGVINRLETVGVFQMESDGMKKTIKEIKPESVEELCYLVAAYRPGPMQFIPEYVAVKRGEQEAHYLFPDLEPILSITNGVVTYQEQVIRIAVDIGGYTMGAADILRKAMGKKKMDVMEKEQPVFIKGGIANGYNEKNLKALWELLVKFANYGFNKAHSAMYATVAYWTAYLKAHYPLEFMASLLEGDMGNFERTTLDLEECTRLGFTVLPPSINKSTNYFSIEGEGTIRFGMGAIKNVGKDIIKYIVEEREEDGDFKHLDDFVYRMLAGKLQPRAVEYLIMAGALDEFGDRNALIQILPNVFDKYKKQRTREDLGQMDIFSMSNGDSKVETEKTEIVVEEPTPVHQILEWEKELLGLYFSSHPLDDLQEFFEAKKVIPIKGLQEKKNRQLVILGVLITNIKRITTKKGDRMAFLSVEDKSGTIDVIIFPRTYEEIKDTFEANKPILIAGRVNVRDEEKSIILEKAMHVDPSKFSSNFKGIIYKISPAHTDKQIMKLKKFIKDNPGGTTVKVIMNSGMELKSMILEQGIEMNKDALELQQKFS